ncbi:MAG: hypothetical protein EOL91_07550 [Actinobacteria bacterium]|nr:hypothetical protein [Actinomycetota bacterium]
MSTADEVQFYARHYRQIEQWAQLEKRVHDVLKDSVKGGDVERALSLISGETGDAELDFYVRNRHLIMQWHSLQPATGLALHQALLGMGKDQFDGAHERRNGWTTVAARSPELEALGQRGLYVELAWMKQHLLSTGRGFPFPRLALAHNPDTWDESSRARLRAATSSTAHALGMKRRGDKWWAHWGFLEGIADGQNEDDYAQQCMSIALTAGERLAPVLNQEIAAMAQHDLL